ncbi:hypothetical protein AB0H83_47895 [Dactylosporangium sp. NPDC050688]|uniref:hypothetical protein n=1 Tax=Dactylosporangium sp. NPDC050688 TaxID=3157217 RepID=UPI0033F4AD63
MIPLRVSTSDYHTAGEPFRIVADPPVDLPGATVADRRAQALDCLAAQGLRPLSRPSVTAAVPGGVRPPVRR